jgi:hypothetical protein
MPIERLIEYAPEYEYLILEPNDYLTEQGLSLKERWGLPFYYGKTWVCYINIPKPKKKGDSHILELCFTRANELPSPTPILDFKGRRSIAGYTFQSPAASFDESLKLIIDDAIELDGSTNYSPKTRREE